MGRNSFEFDRIDQSEQAKLIIKEGEKNRSRIDDFESIYDSETIEADKNLVRRYEKKFSDDVLLLSDEDTAEINYSNQQAEALEVVLTEQSEMAEWFGSAVFAIRTTKYDDYFNGIDMVLEFDMGDSENIERIALAIDASNAKFDIVRKKMDKNIAKVTGKSDKAPEVKYFKSEINPEFKGSIKNVIPVVVGMQGKNVDSLLDSYTSKNSNKEMERHPAQRIFLEEIRSQLEMYLKISEDNSEKELTIDILQVQSLLDIIKNVIQEKEDANIRVGYLIRDQVFQTIMNEAQR